MNVRPTQKSYREYPPVQLLGLLSKWRPKSLQWGYAARRIVLRFESLEQVRHGDRPYH